MLIDAVYADDGLEARELGTPVVPDDAATVTELDEKHATRDQLYDAGNAAGPI